MSPVRGPDGQWHRPAVEHHHQPIVHGARWQVRCNDCGVAFDSAAPSEDAALAEVRADHDPSHVHLSVTAVDYRQHPLYTACRCDSCGKMGADAH